MKKQLEEVVDWAEIKERNGIENMCSCESDVVSSICLSEKYGTCGL